MASDVIKLLNDAVQWVNRLSGILLHFKRDTLHYSVCDILCDSNYCTQILTHTDCFWWPPNVSAGLSHKWLAQHVTVPSGKRQKAEFTAESLSAITSCSTSPSCRIRARLSSSVSFCYSQSSLPVVTLSSLCSMWKICDLASCIEEEELLE